MLSVQGSPGGGEGGSLGDKTQLTTATGQLVCAGHRARGWVSTDAPGVSMDMGWEAWTAVNVGGVREVTTTRGCRNKDEE